MSGRIGDIAVEFTEGSVKEVIHHYTKEAGVRSLEREIAAVCRKVDGEFAVLVYREGTAYSINPGGTVRASDRPPRLPTGRAAP